MSTYQDLDYSNAGSSGGSSRPTFTDPRLPGVRVTKRRIENAKQISGTKPHESFDAPVDLGIHLELETDFDWLLTYQSFGNFKRDKATGRVTGVGSTFKPMRDLARLGVRAPSDGLTPDGQLQRDWITGCIGMEVLVLEYVAKLKEKDDKTYLSYYTFDSLEKTGRPVFDGEDFPHDPEGDTDQAAAQRLLNEFATQANEGWVKRYRPELARRTTTETTRSQSGSGDGASQPAGNPAFDSPSATSGYGTMDPDDDLPF